VDRNSAKVNETTAHPSKHLYTAKTQNMDMNRGMAPHVQAYGDKIKNEELLDRKFSFMHFLFMIYVSVGKRFKFNV